MDILKFKRDQYDANNNNNSHTFYDIRLDNWPVETDRGLFFKITSEIPVHEDTILR